MKKWMFVIALTVLPAFPGFSSAEEEHGRTRRMGVSLLKTGEKAKF